MCSLATFLFDSFFYFSILASTMCGVQIAFALKFFVRFIRKTSIQMPKTGFLHTFDKRAPNSETYKLLHKTATQLPTPNKTDNPLHLIKKKFRLFLLLLLLFYLLACSVVVVCWVHVVTPPL